LALDFHGPHMGPQQNSLLALMFLGRGPRLGEVYKRGRN